MSLDFENILGQMPEEFSTPLTVNEVLVTLRARWGCSYDIQLVERGRYLYLQIMWSYMEQQSFPLDEQAYVNKVINIIEVVNRLGLASYVREWLACLTQRPSVGRALSLRLRGDWRLEEFVL